MSSKYLHTSYDPETAMAIGDQAKLLLAEMLPGCTPRRFDLPDAPADYWGVELCFAEHGPIVPKLTLSHNHIYYTTVGLKVGYRLMLRNPHVPGTEFPGSRITLGVPLDMGPAAIAATMCQTLAKVDYAAMLAAGTVERILSETPRYPVPWPNLQLALCAAYLGDYDEARELLQDALKYADQKGRNSYGTLAPDADAYLSKLNDDPDQLRKELIATMEYNWSHFKAVVQP